MSAVLFACAVMPALAGAVFVLPASPSGTAIPVFTENPFLDSAPLTVAAAPVAVLAKPDGSQFFVVSASGVITILDHALAPLASIDLGSPAQAAALSPNGSRLLVLAGALRVLDTTTLAVTEIAASPAPGIGDNPSGLAFSLDSLRAYVLSGSSNSVTVFDLIASVATGIQIAIPGGVDIAAAPNNQIYVTASDGFYEIDSITGALLARIKLGGLPGKVAFTPDGKFALVANQPPFNAAGLAFLIDLDARTLAGTLTSAGANAGLVLDQLAAVDNTTFYGVSTATQQLVRISLDPSNARDPLTLATTGFPLAGLAGVRALTVSGEQPQARYIYVATADSLSRGSLGSGETQDRSLVVEPAALQLAGAASVATPAGYAKFNDGQTVAAGSITQRLVLRAWGSDGLPVFNKTVQFSTQAAGVTIETPVSRTTSEGYAGTRVIAPETPGQRIRVDVRLEGWSGEAISFTVTVAGGSAVGSGGLEMYSGNGQVVLAGHSTNHPLQVRLTDPAGRPILGATVNWSETSGQGSVSQTASQTDVHGIASVDFRGAPGVGPSVSYVQSTVSAAVPGFAPLSFTETTVSNTVALPTFLMPVPDLFSRVITGQAGQTLAGAIQVQARTIWGIQNGQGFPNVGVSLSSDLDQAANPSASCAGPGGTALSDATGLATCDVHLGGVTGGPVPIRVNLAGFAYYVVLLTVTPGPPGRIDILSGNNQSGNRGATLPVPLVAEISDGFGHLLPDIPVTWEAVVPGTVTIERREFRSGLSGHASAAWVTLGAVLGPVQVRLRAGTAQTLFTLLSSATVSSFSKVSGDSQSAPIGQPFGTPLVVQLLLDQGQALPGIPVTFSVTSGDAALDTPNAVSDGDGRASTMVTAGVTAGPLVVTASAVGLSVSFNLTASPPAPSVSALGIVNAISGEMGVSPGGFIAIHGQGIAPAIQGSVVANGGFPFGALPTSLAGVEVRLGGTKVPIYRVDNMNGQESVLVQAPFTLAPGVTSVTVSVGGVSATVDHVPVKAYQPGIFETPGPAGEKHAVLTKEDGSFVTYDHAALRGEKLRMLCAGLGQAVTAPLVVTVNEGGVRVISAETMPGMTGVYVSRSKSRPTLRRGLTGRCRLRLPIRTAARPCSDTLPPSRRSSDRRGFSGPVRRNESGWGAPSPGVRLRLLRPRRKACDPWRVHS